MNNEANPYQPSNGAGATLPPTQLGHNESVAVEEVKVRGQSRAYLVEYALILIMTGTVLGVITTMLSTILRYTDSGRGHSFFDDYAYKVSVGLIAALVVAVPVLVLLTKRVSKSESLTSSLKNMGWRKGFLGTFLLIVSLYAIGYATAFAYDLVSYFASFGLGGDAKSFPWRGLLENGLTALLFGSTAWLYSYDYRDQPGERSVIGKAHHYGLIALALLLTLIYFGTAFRQQRGEFIDAAIVDDIQSIQSQVSSYESKNGHLPDSLDQLELKDQQKSRAKKSSTTSTSQAGIRVATSYALSSRRTPPKKKKLLTRWKLSVAVRTTIAIAAQAKMMIRVLMTKDDSVSRQRHTHQTTVTTTMI